MIINIIKNPKLFFDLSKYNDGIKQVTNTFNFSGEYDFDKRVISPWFNPDNIRDLGLSRTYPNMCSVQYRKEYCITLHCSNYLPIFLINKLYSTRKDVLIEDVGGGMGWFFYYLSKLGFSNFQLFDNFSQLSQEAAEEFLSHFNIACNIVNPDKLTGKIPDPVVVNNVGIPHFVVREMNPGLELVCCYTNRSLEQQSVDYFAKHNFKFLCKDSDDLAFAYCRGDKYEEYSKILKEFEV